MATSARGQEGRRLAAASPDFDGRFSLVEMMAVLVIIVVVYSLALPFVANRGHSGVTAAARMLAGHLRTARSLAVAQRRYVGVLMPSAGRDGPDGIDSAYQACAVRTCLLAGPPAANSTRQNHQGVFEAYAPDSTWLFMPPGTLIGYTDTHGAVGSDAATCRANVVDGVPFPTSTSALHVDNVRAIIFKPTGAAVAAPAGADVASSDIRVRVAAGVVTEGAIREFGTGDDAVEFSVHRLSGRLRFSEEP